jgi:hypothetical protein
MCKSRETIPLKAILLNGMNGHKYFIIRKSHAYLLLLIRDLVRGDHLYTSYQRYNKITVQLTYNQYFRNLKLYPYTKVYIHGEHIYVQFINITLLLVLQLCVIIFEHLNNLYYYYTLCIFQYNFQIAKPSLNCIMFGH